MPHLLERLHEVAQRLRCSRSVALFLDFDGTLSPIVGQAENAFLERGTRAVLSRLAGNSRVRLCVISGRGRADLRSRVAIPGIDYLGLHGWEKDHNTLSPKTMQQVAEARRALAWRLNGTPGVHIENKGAAFALHYRGAPDRVIQQAETMLKETLAEGGGTLRVLEGDRVWEVLPREVRGKGYAARKQWMRWGMGTLPIYVGNDDTDEDAFQALASGVTARVGPACQSRAGYRLRNPSEVRTFLERLADLLS